jgi:hypothetical protein
MTKEDELTAGLQAELARVNARLAVQDAIVGGTGVLLDGKRIDPASIYAEPKIGCVNHDCDQCKGDRRARQALDEANAYALELQARLAKYEGGATMTLNTAPQPVPVKTYHDGKPWPVAPKPWVGLTDEEIDAIWREHLHRDSRARAIEAKLREKNGGAA